MFEKPVPRGKLIVAAATSTLYSIVADVLNFGPTWTTGIPGLAVGLFFFTWYVGWLWKNRETEAVLADPEMMEAIRAGDIELAKNIVDQLLPIDIKDAP